MSSPIVQPPFSIGCITHEGPHTDMEADCGWKPGPNENVYLRVETPVGSWHISVKRNELQSIFDRQREKGIDIPFGE